MSRGIFLVYSDHSWGRRRFNVRRQINQKFQEKSFQKNFFRLKNTFKSSQHMKVKKKIFRVKSAFSFLRLIDLPFFYNL